MKTPTKSAAAADAVKALGHLVPWWGLCYVEQMREAVERWEIAEDFGDLDSVATERAWLADRIAAWSTGSLLRMPAPIDRRPGEDAHDYAGRLLDCHCYGTNTDIDAMTQSPKRG